MWDIIVFGGQIAGWVAVVICIFTIVRTQLMHRKLKKAYEELLAAEEARKKAWAEAQAALRNMRVPRRTKD